jgi:hypothetical protein
MHKIIHFVQYKIVSFIEKVDYKLKSLVTKKNLRFLHYEKYVNLGMKTVEAKPHSRRSGVRIGKC